ncbi:PDT-domain-containing protein [Testicularia cyperi]|uniref:PDT-domain-containing protein n=1 Tax=Testicularia cyperi TaxID=1882483 RepID=A0A317XXE4_9BASI|nr:PDT-domain-containing protein [Testicularia cyperi]
MASFFAKARERAEAAAQQLQAHASGGSTSNSTANAGSGGGGTSSATNSGSGFSYTGSVPHLLRQGLASVDPRYESNRQFHLLSQAVKSLNIDHEAAGRESKSLAKATFNWGQSHLPENREDGVGDEMLVDVADRLAYIWSEIGQLEAAHSQRSEQARSRLKRFERTEMELGARRTNRAKLKRELHALIPERAKASGASKAQELEKQLRDLNDDDQADEESLSRVKRESLREGYAIMFDSLAELGEKMAIVARYGKLLTQQISTEKSPFPATIKPRGDTIPLWEGASRTAEIRAAVAPALAAYRPTTDLPSVASASSGASNANSLGRADTVSYRVSHRSELEASNDDAHSATSPRNSMSGSAAPSLAQSQTQAQQPHALSTSSSPVATAGRERRSSSTSDHSARLDPSTANSGNTGHRLNLNPTVIPAPTLPPRPSASSGVGSGSSIEQPPRSPVASFGLPTSAEPASVAAAVQGAEAEGGFGSSPPGPTVAETGVVPSGTGGPKSGTLRPRRSSTNQRSASISAGAVAYLGPTGTYTHQAAQKLFGDAGTSLIPMQSITGAIDFVRRGTPGNAKMAIVPVENSTFGPVRDTIDSLLGIGNGDRHALDPSQGAKVHVIGETCLTIDHALLCGPKTYHHLLHLQGDSDPRAEIRDDTLSNITNVISHEQALGQCSHFLTRFLPQARKKAVDSTAAAASTAIEFEQGTAPGMSPSTISHVHESLGFSPLSLVVAIGPETTVEATGVRVLRSRIQDVLDNRTRFLVLASEPAETLLAQYALPTSLSRLYTPTAGAAVSNSVTRAMLRLHDPLSSDTAIEAGAISSGLTTAVSQVLEELARDQEVVVRKIDRRPAAFLTGPAEAASSSIWKCSYLFELQYASDATSAIGGAEARVKQMVLRLSTHGTASGVSSKGKEVVAGATPAPFVTIDHLGSWRVDSQTLNGDLPKQTTGSGAGAGGDRSPSNPFASPPVVPGHGPFALTPPASGSSSSMMPESAAHGAPVAPGATLSERERKEREAQQEAEEVRRHAAEARLSRQQQQVDLYGIPVATQNSGQTQNQQQQHRPTRLGGLQESQDEQPLEDEEDLPAYQAFDPSTQRL